MVDKRHHESIVVIWDRAHDRLFQNTDPPWSTVVDMPLPVIGTYLGNFLKYQGLTNKATQTEEKTLRGWNLSLKGLGQVYLAELENQRTFVSIEPPKDSSIVPKFKSYWHDIMEHFRIWLVQVQAELQPPSEKHTTVKQRKATPKKRAYANTFDQVSKAAKWRQDEINNHGKVPPRTGPNGIRVWCGVDETTVRDHASELWKHWKEKGYVWDKKLDKDEEDR